MATKLSQGQRQKGCTNSDSSIFKFQISAHEISTEYAPVDCRKGPAWILFFYTYYFIHVKRMPAKFVLTRNQKKIFSVRIFSAPVPIFRSLKMTYLFNIRVGR